MTIVPAARLDLTDLAFLGPTVRTAVAADRQDRMPNTSTPPLMSTLWDEDVSETKIFSGGGGELGAVNRSLSTLDEGIDELSTAHTNY